MTLTLYRTVTNLFSPLIGLYLRRRRGIGKEHATRYPERLGIAGQARPSGRLIWMHGASVGEALSLLPLIDRVLEAVPNAHVLITTGTVTSAALLEARLPPRAIHQFVPVDRLTGVRRFLAHWRPDLVLWAESEFWPNLISETAASGVPLVLVNGRVSERSFTGWRRFPGLIRQVLSCFPLCLAQTEIDGDRLRTLGAATVAVPGNIKFAVPPLPVDANALSALTRAIGERPVWLAASTHPGEEAVAWRLHRRLAETHAGLLTIIVPRHPDRGDAVAMELRALGASVARRAANEPLEHATEVYIADTMGELGLFFRLAQAVFMGKSLSADGGQNPLEPARLGCAITYGPRMSNFVDMAERLEAADASVRVADENGLAAAIDELLSDAERRQTLGDAARRFAEGEAEVINRVMAALARFLDPLRETEARP